MWEVRLYLPPDYTSLIWGWIIVPVFVLMVVAFTLEDEYYLRFLFL